MNYFDVIVIGGGASGLMCALQAGRRGRHVLVLDRSNKLGKKILMSGGGRCNFTNLFIEPECFLSDNIHFCKSALSRYTQWDFIAMVEAHGIAYHERKHGELFCDHSSKDILSMLVSECEQVSAELRTGSQIESIVVTDNDTARFTVQCTQGVFACHSLVVATGGLSIPTMGSSGLGYDIANQFDMSVLPRKAGLVPFMFSDEFKGVTQRLSGLALDVELYTEHKSFRENLLFTHRGLSGPVVLQLSNYWQPGQIIYINLLPDLSIFEYLQEQKSRKPKALLRNILNSVLSKNLVAELEQLFWSTWSETIISAIPDSCLKEIADKLTRWPLKPSGTEGYRTAEVTLGGIDTNELSSKTMESKKQAGLYFIGEVVDVTGHLGGFNFQWAWSSAFAAAEHI